MQRDANGAGYAFHYTPDGRLISSELPDGTSRYYLTDTLGSVVAVSGASSFTAKYSYDPYGTTRSTSGGEAGANPFRYAGAYTDAAAGGIYKMGARYYDPASGRFIQGDPSGQEANSFAYAANNPINFVDPFGLNKWDKEVAYTGAALGAVATVAAFIPGAQPIAVAAEVGSLVADGIKTYGDAHGRGDESVKADYESDAVGLATAGTSGLAGKAGLDAASHAFDAAGNTNDAANLGGAYG